MEEAIRLSLIVKRMAEGAASSEEREEWKKADRKSLYSSFNEADVLAISRWQHELDVYKRQVMCRICLNFLNEPAGRNGSREPLPYGETGFRGFQMGQCS